MKKKLYFFGDSISYGHGINLNKTWTNRLSTLLEEEYCCQSPSRNGNTTLMALDRIAHDIETFGADVIFIQFGLNDANYWETMNGLPRVSSNLFEASLTEIVLRSKHIANASKIFLATNHLPTKKIIFNNKLNYKENVRNYNNIIRKVANDNSVILIDHEKNSFEYCSKNSIAYHDILLDDGVHLSTLGHDVYFGYLQEILKENL